VKSHFRDSLSVKQNFKAKKCFWKNRLPATDGQQKMIQMQKNLEKLSQNVF
jgi:hypothetical protein